MKTNSKNGVIGLSLLGAGIGLTAIGFALLAPICISWSRSQIERAYRRGKEGLLSGFETASDVVGEFASKAQYPLSEAAKAARETTAIAAGAVESAAHYIRERVS